MCTSNWKSRKLRLMRVRLGVFFFLLVYGIALHARAEKYAGKAPEYFGMAGCGPGARFMGKDGNQVLAATTNQATSIQTFGASTGTSGCSKPKTIARGTELDEREIAFEELDRQDFEQVYQSRLAIDRARRNGETITLFRGRNSILR